MLGNEATPEAVAALRPTWVSISRLVALSGWFGDLLQGDFGRSFRTGQTVLPAIAPRLPVSIELMLIAQLGALLRRSPGDPLRGAPADPSIGS